MPSLEEILKDRNKYPDTLEVPLSADLKMTLGQLREHNEAVNGSVAQQLSAEREKIRQQQAEIDRGREELVQTFLKLKPEPAPTTATPTPGQDWRTDPFFAPVAQYMDKEIMSKINELATQSRQIQNALAMGVKYIGDMQAKTKFELIRQRAPEDWRKDLNFQELYKTAAEQKMLDEGGFPDVEKAYEKWSEPRQREQLKAQLRAEVAAEEEQRRAQQLLGRPGSGFGTAKAADANAPKNLNDAFNQAKSDPEIMKLIYGGGAA